MTNLEVNLIGHSIWGSGTSRYAVYSLDVTIKNNTYRIYRRYKSFYQLNKQLCVKYPTELEPLQETFPEKGNMGSMINSFDSIVNERTIALQNYLQEILSHNNIKSDEIILTFFDVTNQGASGFRKSVGSQQVLKESSLQVSYISILGLHSWKTMYIGLTKRGLLYIFPTLYDGPDESVTRIDLRSVDARVVGNAGERIIKLFNGDVKFYLKYLSTEEFSSWLRQLSDFGVSAASTTNSNVPKGNNQTNNKQQGNNQLKNDNNSNNNDNNVSQRNAGATDDFSSTYGM